MTRKNLHEKTLQEILHNPWRVCRDNPIISASNVYFYRENGIDLEGEVDNLIFDGALYLIEYKSTTNYRDKAIFQLNKEEKFVRKLGYEGKINKVFLNGDL